MMKKSTIAPVAVLRPIAATIVILILNSCVDVSDGFRIGPLLSTCVDACERGCAEIRKVQSARENNSSSSNNGNDELKVNLKDESDPRSALTVADQASQRVIVGSLKAEWGKDIIIIGEEDDDEEETAVPSSPSHEPLQRNMFEDDIGDDTPEIDPSDVTIFVDPLDGTREFVEGRLENCQVLVGVAIGGEAVAGAVGIPFPNGDMSADATVVYGLVDFGTGVRGTPLKRGPFPLDHHIDGVKYPRPHAATGDSDAPVMSACKRTFVNSFGGSTVVYGGAGNKILGVALGETVCSMSHRVGGPWDLCAPEAILTAMGGELTDLFGEPIRMYDENAPLKANERGFLATTPGSEDIFRPKLTNALLANEEVRTYQRQVLQL